MSEMLKITGGTPLSGAVRIPAAKNSVLPLLAAAVLCRGPVCLRHVPALSDVDACLEILQALGLSAVRSGGSIHVQGGAADGVLPARAMEKMRASVLFLAPVLARTGRVEASLPGGCKLGARPIDIHLDGLAAMGASLHWRGERMVLTAPRGLRGTDYTLRCASVGATETLLLAAATAKGVTVLRNAACEPEILDLAGFLNACGARVWGAGTPVIRIAGVPALTGCVYTPVPDRIIAATLACAAASAGGRAALLGCSPALLAPVLDVLERAGCEVERRAQDFTVGRTGPLRAVGQVVTGPYPAFATDAAPLVAAALLTARGHSCITDTIFAQRFACVQGFAALGAKARADGPVLQITGVSALRPAAVCAPDLRGGAALAVAALAAQGTSQIDGVCHILRGYADLPGLLGALGAKAAMQHL